MLKTVDMTQDNNAVISFHKKKHVLILKTVTYAQTPSSVWLEICITSYLKCDQSFFLTRGRILNRESSITQTHNTMNNACCDKISTHPK